MIGLDTTLRKRRVAVLQLPKQLDGTTERSLLRHLERCTDMDRPYIVVDCSSIDSFHDAHTFFLLCCLEEVMKRNGDIRLAALPEPAVAVRVNLQRLFEVYDTAADAVSSFPNAQVSMILDPSLPQASAQQAESAA